MGDLLQYLYYTCIRRYIIIIYYFTRVIKKWKNKKKAMRILWTYRQHTRTLHHDWGIIYEWTPPCRWRSESIYSKPLCAPRIICVCVTFPIGGVFTLAKWGRNLADLCSNFYRLNIKRAFIVYNKCTAANRPSLGFYGLLPRASISTAKRPRMSYH